MYEHKRGTYNGNWEKVCSWIWRWFNVYKMDMCWVRYCLVCHLSRFLTPLCLHNGSTLHRTHATMTLRMCSTMWSIHRFVTTPMAWHFPKECKSYINRSNRVQLIGEQLASLQNRWADIISDIRSVAEFQSVQYTKLIFLVEKLLLAYFSLWLGLTLIRMNTTLVQA